MSQLASYAPSMPAPFSQEAEEAVIGAVLMDAESFLGLAAFLQADDFFLLRHQYIWSAMLRLSDRNDRIDYLTVQEELRTHDQLLEVGGPGYLTQLINNTPTSSNAEIYGRLVERASTRRRLLQAADEIKSLAMQEDLSLEKVTSEAETRLFRVTERSTRRETITMYQAINDYYGQLEYLVQNKGQPLGLPTGFRDLDLLLGGLQRSDLLIFAGRPGMGKCVAAGTLIPTERGMLPIEQLKPVGIAGIPDEAGGEFYPLQIGVQTPEGLRDTTYFYDSGFKPTLRLQSRAGNTLTGTHVHPVLVLAPTGEKTWKPLSALQAGDYIAVQRHQPGDEQLHKISQYAPEVVSLLEPEFYWDEVTSVEDAGVQHCYDLTVPDGQAFISNGIVSHNTSFLLSVAMNAAKLGARIAIFTMEMGREQIVQRLVSMETGINTQKLRIGEVTPQEWDRFVHAAGRLSQFNVFIDDSPSLTPLQMRTKCRRMSHEHGLDLVIVDYLQLMTAGSGFENNRVQEISYISRNMKELARELNVPVFSAAQLSRAVEQRQDKRPQLSDLRESGCLTGDSLIYLPDEGRYTAIEELAGKTGFQVVSLNPSTWKLDNATVTHAFCTGVKPVYRLTSQLGRTVRATSNHRFLTICGWKRLDELMADDVIAMPRTLPARAAAATMTHEELSLLGHLIGDGCTLPHHALQYTTRENEIAEYVVRLALKVFGDAIKPRIYKEPNRNWYQVFFSASQPLTHGVHNPVAEWLRGMDAFGLRSHEKHVPDRVFQQNNEAISSFLRHLWTTDGCVHMKKIKAKHYPAIYYATSSFHLACDVQSLLLRLSINARLVCVPQKGRGRDQYHVSISGNSDLESFTSQVGTVGSLRQERLEDVVKYVHSHIENTNRDIIPQQIWRMYGVPAMQKHQMTTRTMQAHLGNAYCGTGLYKQNISRSRALRLAHVVRSDELLNLSMSDVYWDTIARIEPDGEAAVYDLTVPAYSNFVANNIVVHNSIEQDADIVSFLYRDAVYNEATEFPDKADVIIAKHRNGPTGTISLHFEKSLTKFSDARTQTIDLNRL